MVVSAPLATRLAPAAAIAVVVRPGGAHVHTIVFAVAAGGGGVSVGTTSCFVRWLRRRAKEKTWMDTVSWPPSMERQGEDRARERAIELSSE